jgi:hypothetical protein
MPTQLGIRTPPQVKGGVCDKTQVVKSAAGPYGSIGQRPLGGNVVALFLFICMFLYKKVPHHPSSVVDCGQERIERSCG